MINCAKKGEKSFLLSGIPANWVAATYACGSEREIHEIYELMHKKLFEFSEQLRKKFLI